MTRYIDAEQAIHLIENDALSQIYYSKSDAIDCINAAPTADVVQVVRCKDCKYFYQDGNIKVCKHWNCHSTTDGAYCSCGERRKEDAKIH